MKVLSISNPLEEEILRSPSRIVTKEDFDNKTVSEVITQLRQTLKHYGNGVGLSAIQIWYPLQIFVINCRPTESFPNMQEFSQVIINPVLKNLSPDTFDWREWCMSIADTQCIPIQRYQIKRSKSILFDYTDERWKIHNDVTLSWISAVVFQHEVDHIHGILIDQRNIPWQIISQEEYMQRKKNGEKMTL